MHVLRTLSLAAPALILAARCLAAQEVPPEPFDGDGTTVIVPMPYGAPAPVSAPSPEPRRAQVDLQGGAITALGHDAGTKVQPFARVSVSAPLAVGQWAPALLLQLDITGLPGESVVPNDPATYGAVEVKAGLEQPLHPKLNFTLAGQGGFSTRFRGRPEPLERSVRWGNVGLRLGRYAGGHVYVGLGLDERLKAGTALRAFVMEGALTLWEDKSGSLKGTAVQLVGDAVLALELLPTGRSDGRADLIRLGIAVSR